MGSLLVIMSVGSIVVVPIGVVVLVAALGMWLVGKITGSKKAKWVAMPVMLIVLCVGFSWQPLLCAFLFKVVVPDPLQEIHQTVASPESVYWQDDVWPGFNAYNRGWMVKEYLDGIHLKALALNGDDGKIYLYPADEKTFAESERLRPARNQKEKEIKTMEQEARKLRGDDHKALWERIQKTRRESTEISAYNDQWKKEFAAVLDQIETYDSVSQLLPMRYRVHFYLLDDWWREKSIYHADQITITEAATGKVIAWSRRYRVFAYWLREPLIINLSPLRA